METEEAEEAEMETEETEEAESEVERSEVADPSSAAAAADSSK